MFRRWRTVGLAGGGVVSHDPLPAEVAEVLEHWRPTKWSENDRRILEPLLPTIRTWVQQMDLFNAHKTRGLLRAASGMVVWSMRSFGNADPTVVFHPSNVETWTMTVQKLTSRWGGDKLTRGILRSLSVGLSIPTVGPLPPSKWENNRSPDHTHPVEERTVPPRLPACPARPNRAKRHMDRFVGPWEQAYEE